MANITGSLILTRAQKTLLDETGVLWALPELLDYLAAGINAICLAKPDVYVQRQMTPLVAGYLQSIPDGGMQFLDCEANAAGGAVREISRNALNHSNPTWRAAAASASIQHFMFDKRDPKRFEVFPPATAGAQAMLCWAAVPPRYTDASQPLPIDDIYESPLHHWVVAYAYLKNAKRGDLQKGTAYMTMFASALGTRVAAQGLFNPQIEDEAGLDGGANAAAGQ